MTTTKKSVNEKQNNVDTSVLYDDGQVAILLMTPKNKPVNQTHAIGALQQSIHTLLNPSTTEEKTK